MLELLLALLYNVSIPMLIAAWTVLILKPLPRKGIRHARVIPPDR